MFGQDIKDGISNLTTQQSQEISKTLQTTPSVSDTAKNPTTYYR